MRNLIAAIYFVLALFGCDGGGTTVVTRASIDGVDVIHSATQVKAGIARFQCIASASGQCHYAVLPEECAKGTPCMTPPDRFTIASGDTREVIGLPKFHTCVAQDEAGLNEECVASR